MRPKEQNTKNENVAETQLITDLYKIIENKRNNMKRVASAELATLFWNIGSELNNLINNNKNKPQSHQDTIRIISKNMIMKYGGYFSGTGLNKMRLFADFFPDFGELQKYIHLLSWEHILVLLKLQNQEARQFYVNLKIKQALGVKELENAIALNVYEKLLNSTYNKEGNTISGKKKEKALQIPHCTIELIGQNDMSKPNLFEKSMLPSFRPLIKTRKQIRKTLNNASQPEPISQLIENYRSQQNKWLNANFILLLWEIGKRIGQEIVLYKPNNKNGSIIKTAPVQLQKNGNIFSSKQLHLMLQFAQRFPTLEMVSAISYMVSWEHLMILMRVREVNDCLFYIRMTDEKGLSVKELKKLVGNGFERLPSDTYTQADILSLFVREGKKTFYSEKKGGSTFNITTTDYEPASKGAFVPNIFGSKYFLDFVSKS